MKYKLEVIFDSETNTIAVQAPTGNFSVCDIMLEGARRVITKQWLELQKTHENKIQIAQPAILPPNGGRM